MRRKILAMIMTFAMIFAAIPFAHAGEATASDLVDLLPGSDAVNEIFLKILNEIMTGNKAENLQEVAGLIDKEYDKPHETAGYAAGENAYYVSLGDSSVTGMNTGDPAYGNNGYKTKVPASAPYQVAQALGLDVYTQYEQLALAGIRTTDLRYILDESFVPDRYTLTSIKNRVNNYAGGFAQMRNDYMTVLPKADLITVSIGNNNFTGFLSVQGKGVIAELLNRELYDVLNKGLFKDKIRETVSQYIDLDSKTCEMSWENYLDKDSMQQLEAALADVKVRLVAEGIPESYSINLAEVVSGMTIPAAVKDKLIVDVPMVELATFFVECFLYSYVTFVVDFEPAFNKIHEIAPNAELLILSLYNPADGLTFTFQGMELPYGDCCGLLAKMMSLHFMDYAETTPKTTFVDVFDTESMADKNLEAGSKFELMDYLEIVANDSGDFHATRAGHTYMKDQILAALKPQAKGLLGDADDSGVVDYVDAMIVLQYHTGIVSGDALDLSCCDVDDSGAVDYVDAMMILQYHTGVINKF